MKISKFFPVSMFLVIHEGLLGALGSKRTKGKYRREHGKDPALGNTETTKPI